MKNLITTIVLVFLCACNKSEKSARVQIADLFTKYQRSFPEIKTMTFADIEKLSSDKYLLVDVREEKEINVSMIEGAVTKAEFDSDKNSHKDKLIIPYCTVGYRSGKFAQTLKADFKVANLAGGILAWVHDGGKVFDGDHETKNVHVYDKKWDLIPKSYKAEY